MTVAVAPAARCALCERTLTTVQPPGVAGVVTAEALRLCVVCAALPLAERKQDRSPAMMRMLDDATSQRRRRHG